MNDFQKRYKSLNIAQKKAVDTIDGPVVVIAGPGTGKTELLSMRVANIVKQTDTLPENILCLTFTESGASAMRERLAGLMGKDGHYVAVNTFHGFGSEAINTHSEYFYNNAQFEAADALQSHQVLEQLFLEIPHGNPLSSKMGDEFTYLRDVQTTISDFKKSGLVPDEIEEIITHNQLFLDALEPYAQELFSSTIGKSTLAKLDTFALETSALQHSTIDISGISSLQQVWNAQLSECREEVQSTQKTAALTRFKNQWFEKNKQNKLVAKDQKRNEKLKAAAVIYARYLAAMQEAKIYDFDDMILRLAHALEVFPELRYNLQEKYQYILVDEFQDTNGAQLRILLSLINAPTSEGRPNIMIVGDDDQAIYSFQGAEVSNIITIQKHFRGPQVITLTDNYRSHETILHHARNIITQGHERLETLLPNIIKNPVAHSLPEGAKVVLLEGNDTPSVYTSISHHIAQKIKEGTAPESIAVLARNHKSIREFLPYLNMQNITAEYEQQNNILEQPPIAYLILFTQVIHAVAKGRHKEANNLLPELLAHPMWELSDSQIWQLSVTAYKEKKVWLEVMQQEDTTLCSIANSIIALAQESLRQPLETTIDLIMGNHTLEEPKTQLSPFKEYFFNTTNIIKGTRISFVEHLQSLRQLRAHLRNHVTSSSPTLEDFITFIEDVKKANVNLTTHSIAREYASSVQCMTIHKSKGLEFDSVYILDANDTTWSHARRGRAGRLGYPENLPIAPSGETNDERLRLFFVACTRAKRTLTISYSTLDTQNKIQAKAAFLENELWRVTDADIQAARVDTEQIQWHHQLSQPTVELKDLLQPSLKHYQLSATHLNAFLDITRGGPRQFLIDQLLHFPKSMPPAAAFGSSIHAALKNAHEQLALKGEQRPIEDVAYDFQTHLEKQHLQHEIYEFLSEKGSDALSAYLAKKYDTFSVSDLAERSFANQHVIIGEAKITGVIDVMRVDSKHKAIAIVDYKTGRPSRNWNGATDNEKSKLHKYRQQLLFYKILIENSRDFRGYTVESARLEYIEPDEHNTLHSLEIEYTADEIEHTSQLIQVVWKHILSADFPDTSGMGTSYKDILSFEKYLLEKQ